MIVGLPQSLTKTISRIVGKDATDANDLFWNERVRELLIIVALHVYQDDQSTDKSWGSVIARLNDPTETISQKLIAVITRVAKSDAKPGSVDWFLADLAEKYRVKDITELSAILSYARNRLNSVEDAIREKPIIAEPDPWTPHGKGTGFIVPDAMSWPTSLLTNDDKPGCNYHPAMSTYFTDKANRLIEFVCETNGLQRGRDDDKIAQLLAVRHNYDVCFRKSPNVAVETRDAERETVLATAFTIIK